jgi:nucleoside-diphosphate-sugar epimerase
MGEQIFVTGGTGFVGAAVVRALVAAGHRVRALTRSEAGHQALSALGAEPVRGDLLDAASLDVGAHGAAVVVHAAASLTSGVRYADHERTNVEGTRLLLAAAKRAGARRFIYVSAASIVVDADRPTEGDESLPVKFHRSMPYSATKGIAERLVLDANGPAMVTLALRPPFIWGERAPSIELIGDAFRRGRFVWIGGGAFPYSVCHVDNLASAVVRSVEQGSGGKPYFVTDDETSSMKSFFTAVMDAAGHPVKAAAVPYWFAALLGRFIGFVFSVFRPDKVPPLTLENVRLMGHTLRVSSARARHELRYAPPVSRADGLERMKGARVRQVGPLGLHGHGPG